MITMWDNEYVNSLDYVNTLDHSDHLKFIHISKHRVVHLKTYTIPVYQFYLNKAEKLSILILLVRLNYNVLQYVASY